VEYKQLLQELGVKVSASKSFDPITDGPGKAEFSKRLIRDGRELSPLSPKDLKQSRLQDFFSALPVADFICKLAIGSKVVKAEKLYPSVLSYLIRSKPRLRRLMTWIEHPDHEERFMALPPAMRPTRVTSTSRFAEIGRIIALDQMKQDLLKEFKDTLILTTDKVYNDGKPYGRVPQPGDQAWFSDIFQREHP
jgi:hypothetical protein